MTSDVAISLRRRRNQILVTLAALAAAGWAILVWQAGGTSGLLGNPSMGLTMGMGFALFLAIWVAMMAAMMFPAVAPMVVMFAQVQTAKRQRGNAAVPPWLFVAAYLLVWTVIGIVAYLAAVG